MQESDWYICMYLSEGIQKTWKVNNIYMKLIFIIYLDFICFFVRAEFPTFLFEHNTMYNVHTYKMNGLYLIVILQGCEIFTILYFLRFLGFVIKSTND